MRTRYKEKIIHAGDMLFGLVYAEFKKGGARRSKWRTTSAIQVANNERRAREELTWLIHTNFNRASYVIALTYDDGYYPESEGRFEKDIRNYISRIKRLYAKYGAVFKYIVVRAYGEGGRCHAHIIVSGGVPRDLLEDAWKYGRTNADRLQFNTCGVVDLSCYIFDQRHAGKRRWSGSRNLEKPHEVVKSGTYSRAQLRDISESAAYPHKFFSEKYDGYWLSEPPRIEKNGINGSYYMTFVMYKPDSDNLEPWARTTVKKLLEGLGSGIIERSALGRRRKEKE